MNIKEDGTYEITPEKHRFSSGVFYVSGDLSTATGVLNYNDNGSLSPLLDGTIVSGNQYDIKHGELASIALVVTGSDGSTDFDISYRGAD